MIEDGDEITVEVTAEDVERHYQAPDDDRANCPIAWAVQRELSAASVEIDVDDDFAGDDEEDRRLVGWVSMPGGNPHFRLDEVGGEGALFVRDYDDPRHDQAGEDGRKRVETMSKRCPVKVGFNVVMYG